MTFIEKSKRSLAKTATFRITVIIADLIIIYALTHKFYITLSIIVLSNLASTILYFLHERIWNRISWGKMKNVIASNKA